MLAAGGDVGLLYLTFFIDLVEFPVGLDPWRGLAVMHQLPGAGRNPALLCRAVRMRTPEPRPAHTRPNVLPLKHDEQE